MSPANYHTASSSIASISGQNVLGDRIANIGTHAIRISIVIVLGWIGAMKFTAYEAGAIEGLVKSSPFVSWLYDVLSLQGASNLIGSIEIVTAILLLIGLKFPRVALLGALAAASTFLVTATFLFSAPGWEASLGGFHIYQLFLVNSY